MPHIPNPFTNRGPVTNREDFFGRKDELETIVSRLRTMQSVSVVGERRIGKSSLLYHLMLTGAERLEDERYRFVYFSLQDAHFQTLAGFCATVLRKLGLNSAGVADGQSAAAKLVAFTDELETLTAASERVVLCLDEFETTFKQRDEFGDGFFEHLRSQLELCKFACLTATRDSLQQLRLDGKLTSPFDNIFTKVALGDFTEVEAAEFIAYYDTLVNFSEAERRFIASYFDPHLYLR